MNRVISEQPFMNDSLNGSGTVHELFMYSEKKFMNIHELFMNIEKKIMNGT